MLNDDDGPGGRRSKGDYEVGYGKPPVRTRFQKGNPGRRKGSGKKKLEFGEELRRKLLEGVKIKQGDRIVKRSMPELIADRVKRIAIQGNAKELEAVIRLIERHAPDLLKLSDNELQVTYHHAEGSTVPLPSPDLFEEQPAC